MPNENGVSSTGNVAGGALRDEQRAPDNERGVSDNAEDSSQGNGSPAIVVYTRGVEEQISQHGLMAA